MALFFKKCNSKLFTIRNNSKCGKQWFHILSSDTELVLYGAKKPVSSPQLTLAQFIHSDRYKRNQVGTLQNGANKHVTSLYRYESSSCSKEAQTKLTSKDRLKKAIAEYGSTVIIFHVGISLISLGSFYVLVSSGIDMNKLLLPIGIGEGTLTKGSTFVAAYAIHKVFAPVRISITLAATPFIVRFLRNAGYLKK